MSQTDSRWVCWDCGDIYATEERAMKHCERHNHWLGEHRSAFRGNPATRTMHASDWGGVYVDDYPPELARQMADEYRRRVSAGAF